MRVIAGNFSGRSFDSVPGHRTHPMSEKIRGAVFNALGDITDLSVLDAYGGTGALSIEALSRGAAAATILEADKTAARTIKENLALLQLEQRATAIRIYAHAWSRRHAAQRFDIVLLDPPYDAVEPKELVMLAGHAKQGGIIVLSLPPHSGFRLAESRQQLLRQKNYGDAELYFYRQLCE